MASQADGDIVYETLVGIAVPGAVVGRGEDPEIVVNGHVRHALTPGYRILNLESGKLACLAVDFPDDIEPAVDALESFNAVPPNAVLSHIVIARYGTDGALREQASGVVETDATVTQVGSLDMTGGPTAGWPELHIVYRGMYRRLDSVSSVEWEALWDPQQRRIVERLPVRYWKNVKVGTEQYGEIAVTRTQTGVTLQVGSTSLNYECNGRCNVPTELILSAM